MKSNRFTIPAGTRIHDRYIISSMIGRGGVGTTYRAQETQQKNDTTAKRV